MDLGGIEINRIKMSCLIFLRLVIIFKSSKSIWTGLLNKVAPKPDWETSAQKMVVHKIVRWRMGIASSRRLLQTAVPVWEGLERRYIK